jgi:hypothetical protein
LANLLSGEDDGQFEPRLSPNQFQFRRPNPPQTFLPKEFDRAQGLGGGLAGNFLDALEMDEILTQLLGRDHLWSALEMLSPLANTGQVSFLGSWGDRQKLQILGEGV